MATQKQRAAARSNVKKAQARKLNIGGRSKMGKDELKRAVGRAR